MKRIRPSPSKRDAQVQQLGVYDNDNSDSRCWPQANRAIEWDAMRPFDLPSGAPVDLLWAEFRRPAEVRECEYLSNPPDDEVEDHEHIIEEPPPPEPPPPVRVLTAPLEHPQPRVNHSFVLGGVPTPLRARGAV